MEYFLLVLFLTVKISEPLSATSIADQNTKDDQTCTENKLYPDPKSCQKYYVCTNGVLESRTCPDMDEFSLVYQWCLPPKLARCSDKAPQSDVHACITQPLLDISKHPDHVTVPTVSVTETGAHSKDDVNIIATVETTSDNSNIIEAEASSISSNLPKQTKEIIATALDGTTNINDNFIPEVYDESINSFPNPEQVEKTITTAFDTDSTKFNDDFRPEVHEQYITSAEFEGTKAEQVNVKAILVKQSDLSPNSQHRPLSPNVEPYAMSESDTKDYENIADTADVDHTIVEGDSTDIGDISSTKKFWSLLAPIVEPYQTPHMETTDTTDIEDTSDIGDVTSTTQHWSLLEPYGSNIDPTDIEHPKDFGDSNIDNEYTTEIGDITVFPYGYNIDTINIEQTKNFGNPTGMGDITATEQPWSIFEPIVEPYSLTNSDTMVIEHTNDIEDTTDIGHNTETQNHWALLAPIVETYDISYTDVGDSMDIIPTTEIVHNTEIETTADIDFTTDNGDSNDNGDTTDKGDTNDNEDTTDNNEDNTDIENTIDIRDTTDVGKEQSWSLLEPMIDLYSVPNSDIKHFKDLGDSIEIVNITKMGPTTVIGLTTNIEDTTDIGQITSTEQPLPLLAPKMEPYSVSNSDTSGFKLNTEIGDINDIGDTTDVTSTKPTWSFLGPIVEPYTLSSGDTIDTEDISAIEDTTEIRYLTTNEQPWTDLAPKVEPGSEPGYGSHIKPKHTVHFSYIKDPTYIRGTTGNRDILSIKQPWSLLAPIVEPYSVSNSDIRYTNEIEEGSAHIGSSTDIQDTNGILDTTVTENITNIRDNSAIQQLWSLLVPKVEPYDSNMDTTNIETTTEIRDINPSNTIDVEDITADIGDGINIKDITATITPWPLLAPKVEPYDISDSDIAHTKDIKDTMDIGDTTDIEDHETTQKSWPLLDQKVEPYDISDSDIAHTKDIRDTMDIGDTTDIGDHETTQQSWPLLAPKVEPYYKSDSEIAHTKDIGDTADIGDTTDNISTKQPWSLLAPIVEPDNSDTKDNTHNTDKEHIKDTGEIEDHTEIKHPLHIKETSNIGDNIDIQDNTATKQPWALLAPIVEPYFISNDDTIDIGYTSTYFKDIGDFPSTKQQWSVLAPIVEPYGVTNSDNTDIENTTTDIVDTAGIDYTTNVGNTTGISGTIDIVSTTNIGHIKDIWDTTDIRNTTDIRDTTDIWDTTDHGYTANVGYTTDIKHTTDIADFTEIGATTDIRDTTDVLNTTEFGHTENIWDTTDIGSTESSIEIVAGQPSTSSKPFDIDLQFETADVDQSSYKPNEPSKPTSKAQLYWFNLIPKAEPISVPINQNFNTVSTTESTQTNFDEKKETPSQPDKEVTLSSKDQNFSDKYTSKSPYIASVYQHLIDLLPANKQSLYPNTVPQWFSQFSTTAPTTITNHDIFKFDSVKPWKESTDSNVIDVIPPAKEVPSDNFNEFQFDETPSKDESVYGSFTSQPGSLSIITNNVDKSSVSPSIQKALEVTTPNPYKNDVSNEQLILDENIDQELQTTMLPVVNQISNIDKSKPESQLQHIHIYPTYIKVKPILQDQNIGTDTGISNGSTTSFPDSHIIKIETFLPPVMPNTLNLSLDFKETNTSADPYETAGSISELHTTAAPSDVTNSISTDPSLLSENICVDNNLVADPTDCEKYFQCKNNTLQHLTCLTNYKFSITLKRCLPANLVSCKQNNGPTVSSWESYSSTPRESETVPNLAHHTPAASSLLIPFPKTFALVKPVASSYDLEVNLETSTSPICTGNEIYPDATDCKKYFICKNGKLYHRHCSGVDKFNIPFVCCLPSYIANCPKGLNCIIKTSDLSTENPADIAIETKPSNNIENINIDSTVWTGLNPIAFDNMPYQSVKVPFGPEINDKPSEGKNFEKVPYIVLTPVKNINLINTKYWWNRKYVMPDNSEIVWARATPIKSEHDIWSSFPSSEPATDNWIIGNLRQDDNHLKPKVMPLKNQNYDDAIIDSHICTENDIFPYESDCSKFYQCLKGKLVRLSCPEGLTFSKAYNVCSLGHNENCGIDDSSERSGKLKARPITHPNNANPVVPDYIDQIIKDILKKTNEKDLNNNFGEDVTEKDESNMKSNSNDDKVSNGEQYKNLIDYIYGRVKDKLKINSEKCYS